MQKFKKIKQKWLYLCAILLTLSVFTTHATVTKIDSQPLPYGQRISLPSKILASTQTIDVYLPDGYQWDAEHMSYPVIYTLDGWTLSQSVSGMVAHLGNTDSMPKAIVVAIQTNEDYRYGPEIYNSQSGWDGEPKQRLDGFSGGQADTYLKFFQEELIPFIDNSYRSNDFRILIGMSPTAAFALHTFWRAPDLFDGHFLFAATDVLGMGYTPETTFIDKIVASLADNPTQKRYLYIASAQKEADKKPQRALNVAELIQRTAPYTSKNFTLKAEHITDYGHYPMALPGLLTALDMVFPRKRFSQLRTLAAAEGNILNNIDQYYKKLSLDIGFTIYPNADLRRNASCLRVMGYRRLAADRVDDAIELFTRWIHNTPKNPEAYDHLAKALAKNGQHKAAMTASEQALLLGIQSNHEYLDWYKTTLQERKVAASE